MEELEKQLEEIEQKYDLEEMMKMFRECLKTKADMTEQQVIGAGGRSPFGAYGYHPGGVGRR